MNEKICTTKWIVERFQAIGSMEDQNLEESTRSGWQENMDLLRVRNAVEPKMSLPSDDNRILAVELNNINMEHIWFQ